MPEEQYKVELPNPNIPFCEEDFIKDFIVFDNKKNPLKLKTYREPAQNNQDIKAIIVIFPGFTCHLNCYSHFAKEFSKLNYVTVGYDPRGFGKSEGMKGGIENFQFLVDDCMKFLKKLDEMYDVSIPRFLIGESMGCTIGIQSFVQNPSYFQDKISENFKSVKGMIFMCPAIKGCYSTFTLKYGLKLCKILKCINPNIRFGYWPICKLAYHLQPFFINLMNCKNPNLKNSYKQDPLMNNVNCMPVSIVNLFAGIDQNFKDLNKFPLPIMIIQGGMDKIVDPEGAFDLMEQSISKDKTLIFLPNAGHALQQEEEYFEYMPMIKTWISQQISGSRQEYIQNQLEIEKKIDNLEISNQSICNQ